MKPRLILYGKHHPKLGISKKIYHISVVTMSRLKVVITLEEILKKVYILWGILPCQLVVTDVSKAPCAFQASLTLYRLTRRDNIRIFNFQCQWFEKVRYRRYERIEFVPRSEHSLYLSVNTVCTSQWTQFVRRSEHSLYVAVSTVCTSQWTQFVTRSEHS